MSSLGTQALLSPKQHSATAWERIWRMWILNGNFLLVFSLSDGKVTSKLELCQGVCRNMSSGEGALLAALAHKVLRGSQLYWRTANWNWEELSAPLTNVTPGLHMQVQRNWRGIASSPGEQIDLAALVPGSTGLHTVTQALGDRKLLYKLISLGFCTPLFLTPRGSVSLQELSHSSCTVCSVTSDQHGDSAVRACDGCSLWGIYGTEESWSARKHTCNCALQYPSMDIPCARRIELGLSFSQPNSLTPPHWAHAGGSPRLTSIYCPLQWQYLRSCQ